MSSVAKLTPTMPVTPLVRTTVISALVAFSVTANTNCSNPSVPSRKSSLVMVMNVLPGVPMDAPPTTLRNTTSTVRSASARLLLVIATRMNRLPPSRLPQIRFPLTGP